MSNTPLNLHPCVALVGRPNVGKSTLFNRLIGARKAVVSSIRGTTRDRLYGRAEWRGMSFAVIGMGGVEFSTTDDLAQAVQRHVQHAVQDADGFVLVCDAQDGLVPADEMILELLRKTSKPVLLVANKMDSPRTLPPEFYSLGGVDETIPISALHGRGVGELLDALVVMLRPLATPMVMSQGPALAIVGRQNVGKSSLFNAFLREERVIVSDRPGTTRDAVDTAMTFQGQPVVLVDTAGLRHRRKVKSPIDLFSMGRTLQAVERCDVALVVLDATLGVTQDDRRLVSKVLEAGCGVVLLPNKWDVVKSAKSIREQTLTETMHRSLPGASFAPVVAISAKTGFQVPKSLMIALQVGKRQRAGLSDEALLLFLRQAWASRPVPRLRGRPVFLQQVRWVPGRPPRIEVETHPGGRLPVAFHNYLLKRIHAHPALSGVSVRLVTNPESRPAVPRVR